MSTQADSNLDEAIEETAVEHSAETVGNAVAATQSVPVGGGRGSRLPALRRYRDARRQMSLDTAAKRAEAVAQIAEDVTNLIVEANEERRRMAAETAAARAEAIAQIAGRVTDLTLAARQDLADQRNARTAWAAALRTDMASARAELSSAVKSSLEANAGDRAERRSVAQDAAERMRETLHGWRDGRAEAIVETRQAMAAFRADLHKEVVAIVSSDFS